MSVDSAEKIRMIIEAYLVMEGVVRSEGNPVLDRLANGWCIAIHQMEEKLSLGVTPAEAKLILRGIRQGLRETPELLSSIGSIDGGLVLKKMEAALGRHLQDF